VRDREILSRLVAKLVEISGYFLQMEHAFCLLSAGDRGSTIQVYDHVKHQWPKSAIAPFRRGQALFEEGKTDEALSELEVAVANFPEDAILDRKEPWLLRIGRLLGYLWWQKSRQSGAASTDPENWLLRAYQETKRAVDTADQAGVDTGIHASNWKDEKCTCYNNITYYASKYIEQLKDGASLEINKGASDEINKDVLCENLKKLEECVGDVSRSEDTAKLDTLISAYSVLERNNRALSAAKRVKKVLDAKALQSIGKYDKPLTYWMIRDVLSDSERSRYDNALLTISKLQVPSVSRQRKRRHGS